jgi:hypothetical protein
MTIKGEVLDAALGRLEALEYASLVWGFVDGGMSEKQLRIELATIAQTYLSTEVDDSADKVIVELLESGLLFESKTLGGDLVFRTRFAEGVRLFAHLRQWLSGDWRTGRPLVADYRVDHRPRRYPKRELDPRQVLEGIAARKPVPRISASIWHEIVPSNGRIMLSGFQARSAETLLANEAVRGIIVTAGTGSGKTLAFYLPALAGIGELVRPGQYWTKILAIYPRVELLKDQFTEALGMCSKISRVMRDQGRRPITLGTLFGETPEKSEWCNWSTAQGSALACPYAKCPASGCQSELVWGQRDRLSGRERLVCHACGHSIEDDSIVLTRQRALREPPDILFTTTEMLHKRMADTSYRHLLGIGLKRDRRVRYVLMDEVHTYTGFSGAQSGMVIRRWRHASQSDATIVGLSATLLEADRFFHELTGLSQHLVRAEEAYVQEFVDEGAEYQLVVQGDPVSQTSLLSTSIQSSMLLARLMDPLGIPKSQGKFGNRIFVFTDDLDVNTRLYDDLRDAEGTKPWGGRKNPLAALRAGIRKGESEAQRALRHADGQSWNSLERIGHELGEGLRVGRTSSRDPGVTQGLNVVVATASLEVGYNDVGVGAVMQHKAPKNMAAFLQRKGRAGRLRGMRPWIVTVLSDYGRDRITFHNYDQLFDPVIQAQHLPIRNLYLLRMQALAAFLDWLASRSPMSGWFWKGLSSPNLASKAPEMCKYVQNEVKLLLAGDEASVRSLSDYLIKALDLSEAEVVAVLYAPPRSLLLEALPTLQRRIATNWQCVLDGTDWAIDRLPLPEFMAPNLFTQLALPEVAIEVQGLSSPEYLPIARSLREIMPGRVTRRYAEQRANVSHWVPIEVRKIIENCEKEIEYLIDDFAECCHAFNISETITNESIPVYRPLRMKLNQMQDPSVSKSSNAFLEWFSDFLAQDPPLFITPSRRSRWRGIIEKVEFHLHAHSAPVTVRRFGSRARVSLRINGNDVPVDVNFVDKDGRRAGLGFEFDTDGILVNYRLPLATELVRLPLSDDVQFSLRRAFFRDQVLADEILQKHANQFKLDWLQQVFLTTITAWASVKGICLAEAHKKIRDRCDIRPFQRAMSAILGLGIPTSSEEQGASESVEDDETPLYINLSTLLEVPTVLSRLHEIAIGIYDPNEAEFGTWLRARLHESMVQSVHYACMKNVPKHATMETLLADPWTVDPDSEHAEIWITEDSLGGSGVLEALTKTFMDDPGMLFSGIEAAVAPTDRELVSHTLERITVLASEYPLVAEALASMRSANYHDDRARFRCHLVETLRKSGVTLGKAASIALNARLLRPGMGEHTDRLIAELIRRWDDVQVRLGVAIGLKEYCAIIALDDEYRAMIRNIAPEYADVSEDDVAAVLMGILWPRGQEVRQYALDSYNPYRRSTGHTEPRLVCELLMRGAFPSIALEESDWRDRIQNELRRHGTCRLMADRRRHGDLAAAVARILTEPVDVGYLQYFPCVERTEQDATHLSVVLTIWEEL